MVFGLHRTPRSTLYVKKIFSSTGRMQWCSGLFDTKCKKKWQAIFFNYRMSIFWDLVCGVKRGVERVQMTQ